MGNLNDGKTCGHCKHFIGGGDWNLCCTEQPYLCYAETAACRAFKERKVENMIDPRNDDFGAICNCAVRYCMGRRSYMPGIVIRFITPYLPVLSNKTLWCFERDIEEHERMGLPFGDECDVKDWLNFSRAVKAEIEKREKEKKR